MKSQIKPTRATAVKVIELLSHGLVRGLGKQKPGEMCIEAVVCCALGLPHGDNQIIVRPKISNTVSANGSLFEAMRRPEMRKTLLTRKERILLQLLDQRALTIKSLAQENQAQAIEIRRLRLELFGAKLLAATLRQAFRSRRK
jgi:hypothetical protein